jgi:hypothetical protein
VPAAVYERARRRFSENELADLALPIATINAWKDGKNGTRVELEHRRLDLYGARRDEMRGIFDSEGGWSGLLESFARTAST